MRRKANMRKSTRQRRSDRCGSQGPEDGYAAGQCDPSGNGRASSFSEPRTTHDAGKASRKISRCSGAHAARLEDRDQWTKPPGSDQSGALSSRSGRTRTRSPNESQPAAGMAIRFGEKSQSFSWSPVLVVGERSRAAWFARGCISGTLPTICIVRGRLKKTPEETRAKAKECEREALIKAKTTFHTRAGLLHCARERRPIDRAS